MQHLLQERCAASLLGLVSLVVLVTWARSWCIVFATWPGLRYMNFLYTDDRL